MESALEAIRAASAAIESSDQRHGAIWDAAGVPAMRRAAEASWVAAAFQRPAADADVGHRRRQQFLAESGIRTTKSGSTSHHDIEEIVKVQALVRGFVARLRHFTRLEQAAQVLEQELLEHLTESSEGSACDDDGEFIERPAVFVEAMRRIYDGIHSRAQALTIFTRLDRDKSGSLDAAELQRALKLLHLNLGFDQVKLIVDELDRDGDQEVDIQEFMRLVWDGKLDRIRKKLRGAGLGQGWSRLFHNYDRDNSGGLDFDEFRRAVRKDAKITTHTVTDSELQELYTHIDESGDDSLSLAEFTHFLESGPPTGAHARHASLCGQALFRIIQHAEERKANLMYMFHRHDKDGSGDLDREEFVVLLEEIGVELTDVELTEVMGAMDSDGDGSIDVGEFAKHIRQAKKDAREATSEPYVPKKLHPKTLAVQLRTASADSPLPPPLSRTPRRAKGGGSPARGTRSRAQQSPARSADRARGSVPKAEDSLAVELQGLARPAAVYIERPAVFVEAMRRIYDGIHSRAQALTIFTRLDRDKSGSLDAAELQRALKLLHLNLGFDQVKLIVDELDRDGDQEVDIQEFMRLVWDGKLDRIRKKLRGAGLGQGWSRLFHNYDRDNSGGLDFDEFRRAVRKDAKITTHTVTDSELQELYTHIDESGDDSLSLAEFTHFLESGPPTGAHARHASLCGQALFRIIQHAEERKANLMYMFHRHDKDGSGDLDREEFVVLLEEIGVELTDVELTEVMGAMDSDGDGSIDVGEFAKHIRQAKKDAREAAIDRPRVVSPRSLRDPAGSAPASQHGLGLAGSPSEFQRTYSDSLNNDVLEKPFRQAGCVTRDSNSTYQA